MPTLLHNMLHIVTPMYILMTVIAAWTRASSFLTKVTSHGKTIRSITSSATSSNPFSKALHWISDPKSSSMWVPKSYFSHFYIVALLAWFSMLLHLLSSNYPIPTPLIVLVTIHLCRRNYECVFVHQWRKSSKMHIIVFVVGIVHYLLLPLALVVQTPTRNPHFIHILPIVLLNIWAQYEQHLHHRILANLRNTAQVYGLPTQRWFQRLTCPHYFAEILIYLSFFLLTRQFHPYPSQMTDMSLMTHISLNCRDLALLVWVTSNLTINAMNSHDWYRTKYIDTKSEDTSVANFVASRNAMFLWVL